MRKIGNVIFVLFPCILQAAHISVAFNFVADPGNLGLSGHVRICNTSSLPVPPGYHIDFRWPSLQALSYGPVATRLGAGACDRWRLSFENWQLPAPNSCRDISAGNANGAYQAPLRYPAYGIDSAGDTVWVINGGNSFIPKSYNQSNGQYTFDPSCFLPTGAICLGEAQLREWNAPWDVRVPDNRKSWALAAAHISTLFNNMVGAQVVSVNYAFAQSMIEGRMGCDATFIPPASDNNPLQFSSLSQASGCFQILPPGFAQLQQYYPSLMAPLSYSNIIANENFVTSGLAKALYDMTTFVKYEKINCVNPIGFFTQSADPYAAEEILAYAYHEGPYGSEAALLNMLRDNRAAALTEPNLARYLQLNFANASTQYAERMRNNLIQLENNFSVPGAHSAISIEASTNWRGGSPPDDYEWHGCYNESFTWAEISDYIDEAARLFWTGNVPLIKANTKAVFDNLNGGAAVPYAQLGVVIDAIVLNFPAYSPDEGLGDLFFASACGSPSVSMSSCDVLCSGQQGELWVHLMGTPPFSYTIQGPGSTLFVRNHVSVATDVIRVNQPGTYKVLSIQDAHGNVFLNCHAASASIQTPPACTLPVEWKHWDVQSTQDGWHSLQWLVLESYNHQGYWIERSLDGNVFEPLEWVELQQGQGLRSYARSVKAPSQPRSYYRLVQQEMDGEKNYTEIRCITDPFLFPAQVSVLGSPAYLHIQLLDQEFDIQKIYLIDAAGKIVWKQEGGAQSLYSPALPGGWYVLCLEMQETFFTQKVAIW
ncbi:MAG: hypothetical protein MUF42_16520 [Cytophagaceae bacterium]|jgi:hypothetical protein|nr:hypothetical protein [Cytophagaceae bacterium]